MKTKDVFIAVILFLTILSCKKDPLDEIEEGSWNNERNIVDVTFDNQVGKSEIIRDDDSSGTIIISINVDAVPDLSNITLNSIQTSYKANTSIQVGEALNFENPDHTSSITVTSPTGKSRAYTIHVNPFQEKIIGTYTIDNLVVYGGTGPEYGGARVLSMTDKPWVWPENGGPAAELDNTLTFVLDGITEEGNTYGTIINNPGGDGLYANYNFVGNPETDVNSFYRKIPKGEGTWSRNYTTGLVTFTFPDGTTTNGTFIESGTQDLGNDNTKTTANYAFKFDLSGTDDWDKIYSDYDKFVKRPRIFWIDCEKL